MVNARTTRLATITSPTRSSVQVRVLARSMLTSYCVTRTRSRSRKRDRSRPSRRPETWHLWAKVETDGHVDGHVNVNGWSRQELPYVRLRGRLERVRRAF